MGSGEGTAVGIDWSSGSWIAIVFEGDQYDHVEVESQVATLYERYADADRILIDIPIGLISANWRRADGEKLSRKCDLAARAVVGKQSSSVFPAPAREAVKAAVRGETHAVVSRKNQKATGKGLSAQSKAIASGIHAVDTLLQDRSVASETLIESHPEVVFRGLSSEPLEYSKKTAPGYGERLDALATVLDDSASTARQIATDLAADDNQSDHDIGIDDLLDALALAVAATASSNEFHFLPSDPPRDSVGLPMQIAYSASESFDRDQWTD